METSLESYWGGSDNERNTTNDNIRVSCIVALPLALLFLVLAKKRENSDWPLLGSITVDMDQLHYSDSGDVAIGLHPIYWALFPEKNYQPKRDMCLSIQKKCHFGTMSKNVKDN